MDFTKLPIKNKTYALANGGKISVAYEAKSIKTFKGKRKVHQQALMDRGSPYNLYFQTTNYKFLYN